ncbi:MAG UNVERIFIED_CONTAM: polysaccharide deacetylase family protein, partial [Thermobifida fusca]
MTIGLTCGIAAPAHAKATADLVTTTGRAGKTVALTFDDGPDPDNTPALLEVLHKYQVKAVFCLVGDQARNHPDLVRRIVLHGHT